MQIYTLSSTLGMFGVVSYTVVFKSIMCYDVKYLIKFIQYQYTNQLIKYIVLQSMNEDDTSDEDYTADGSKNSTTQEDYVVDCSDKKNINECDVIVNEVTSQLKVKKLHLIG